MKLSELFDLYYGSKLDLNKMTKVKNGINFVGRSEKNLGVVAKVKQIPNKRPYESGLITVALGGSPLESFVQPRSFYTAQNVMVLKPRVKMTFQQKIYYCICIKRNNIRYAAYGREANRTLSELIIPSKIPDWVNTMPISSSKKLYKRVFKTNISLSDRQWSSFRYDELFEIERGTGAKNTDVIEDGRTLFVTSLDNNNGVTGMVNKDPTHDGNMIGVNRIGSVGEAFYQLFPFCSTENVHIFKPKFQLNSYIAMFLITLIRKEKYRYGYGRTWSISRMKKSIIKLPIDENNKPDWKFMEYYIKSLPYSSNLRIAQNHE